MVGVSEGDGMWVAPATQGPVPHTLLWLSSPPHLTIC